MKLLAKRIEVSQIDEIGMMKGWLRRAAKRCPTSTRITPAITR